MEKMQKMVFPTFKQEASQLYAIGSQQGGILSRQPGEPMTSYIERRTQWWKLVQEFDNTIVISDEIRGDQLLENSGLTRDQKTMIMVSTSNSLAVDAVKEALIAQYGVTHVKSHNYQSATNGRQKAGHRPWTKGRGKGYTRSGYTVDYYDDSRDLDQ